MSKFTRDSAIDLDLPLSFQIAQLHSALNAQAKAIIARHGNLNIAQWRIIRLVAWDIANTTTTVRKAAGIDKSQFSKTLSVLEREGFVEILPYEDDKRQHLIVLTTKGVEAHDRLGPELDARHQYLLASLNDDQREMIHEAIKALSEAAETTDFSNV
ncbi:hypothetical protein NBRC116601_18270 [Cognatishimia sp. WU-CL00825]|uniref:MarR family winged helix-turn-helix transcriptional regulator n=1 Tax=Cognatishimia sp. WU-CL00825 TaxID=3127658 RepID=UPI003108C6A0